MVNVFGDDLYINEICEVTVGNTDTKKLRLQPLQQGGKEDNGTGRTGRILP